MKKIGVVINVCIGISAFMLGRKRANKKLQEAILEANPFPIKMKEES